jgi:hypothetical protein
MELHIMTTEPVHLSDFELLRRSHVVIRELVNPCAHDSALRAYLALMDDVQTELTRLRDKVHEGEHHGWLNCPKCQAEKDAAPE